MAIVNIFVAREKKFVIIVPFARDAISDRASGKNIELAWDRFCEVGPRKINEILDHFFEADATEPSEFYQLTPRAEREKIIKNSLEFTISKFQHEDFATVWSINFDDSIKIPYPVDDKLMTAIEHFCAKQRPGRNA